MANFNTDQQAAIELADRELEVHFPGKMNFGVVYQPINVSAAERSANALNKIYTVMYSLPLGPTDQDILITVDIKGNKILSFEKSQA